MRTRNIRRFITGLDGSAIQPVLSDSVDENKEMKYRAIIITYDIPAPHILGLPKKCTKAGGISQNDCSRCREPCAQKLKSMRNAINHWLRQNCMRVSDSEYMVPQATDDEAQKITDDWCDRFVEPFGELYKKWTLRHVLEPPYVVNFDATGMVTKAAHVLLDLFYNVEATFASVEKAIRFHKNAQDSDTFEMNKFTFDPKGEGTERAISLNPTQIKAWYKKISAYEEVLGDFLTADATDAANLGSIGDVEQMLDTCLDRIHIAAQLAGIELL